MSSESFYYELTKLPLFQAIHVIEEVLLKAETLVGTDTLPKHEKINLKTNASLGYEHYQLLSVAPIVDNKLLLQSNLIGLTGEQGVMPQHYSELALQRQKESDTAMLDFYNIFNHRLISLYYRSWQLSQLAVQVRSHAHNRRSPLVNCIEALTGHGGELSLYFGGLYASPTRSKSSLKGILECLSGCEVHIHELQGEWIHLSEEQQTRLVSKAMPEGQFSKLGNGASLGAKAWDINAGVLFELFPKQKRQVDNLLGSSPNLNVIKTMASEFIGAHRKIKWQMTTKHSLLPLVQISKQYGQLGSGSVLIRHKRTEDREITITL